jgi:thiol-disulfide isomerase/thioredoxin
MRYRRLGLAAVMAAVVFASAVLQKAPAMELPDNWIKSWDEAAKQAKAEKKPMIAVFSAEWCGPCKMMAKEVYPKENVRTVLKDWVAVYVDGDKEPERAAKFSIEGYPTYVLLSPEGVEEDRFVGARPEETFVDILKNHGANKARIAEIKAGLEKTPEDAKLWAELGQVMEKKDKMEEAIAAYEKAAFYDPKDATGVADDLFLLKAIPKTADELENAGKQLAQFEAKFPKSPLLAKVFLFRGFIAADLEKLDEAKAILKEGAARFPESEYAATMKNTIEELEAATAN